MQAAVALGQLIAPAPKAQGPVKPGPDKKTSEATDRQSVKKTNHESPEPQIVQKSSTLKSGSTFANQLKKKLKEQKQEKTGAGSSESEKRKAVRPTVADVHPLQAETPRFFVSPAKPPAAKTAASPVAAVQAKPAAVVKAGPTQTQNTEIVKKSGEKVTGQTGRTAVKEAKPKETSPEQPVEVKSQDVKPSPASPTEIPAAKKLSTGKPDNIKSDTLQSNTPTKPHPVPPAASQGRKTEEKEPLQENSAPDAEKKTEAFQIKTSKKQESSEPPTVEREPGQPASQPADSSAFPIRQATRDIGVPRDIKPELNITETKEISHPSTGSVFTLHTPSQQVLKHLPDAAALAPRQIRITLSPAELGTVRIAFQRDNQEISGLIEAQRPEVRREIEQAMPQIISTLQQQGLSVRRIDVHIMPDASANRDTSGALNDSSMQREFAQSGGHDFERESAFSDRSSENPAGAAEEWSPFTHSKRSSFSGGGLNLYI